MKNYILKLNICFVLFFNLCYAMDPNDSSILNEEFTLNTNDIHPPLEVWEQFFTKNNLDLDKIILYENFYKNISTKKIDETFNQFHKEIIKIIEKKILNTSKVTNCLTLFYGINHIIIIKNCFINSNTVNDVKNTYFYNNYLYEIEKIDLERIIDTSYFLKWKKAITINPFPEFEISKEVQNILKDTSHPKYKIALSLALVTRASWVYLYLTCKIHNILFEKEYKNKSYIDKMLAAGYNKINNSWHFIDNGRQIPSVDYYFLFDYSDNCPKEWQDIFNEHSKLFDEKIINDEEFKRLLNLYHNTHKIEKNIPSLLKIIKDFKNYINTYKFENPYDHEKDIDYFAGKKELWCKYAKKLETVNPELTPQELKTYLITLLNKDIEYIQEKLNIDINSTELNKIDDIYTDILNLCNIKYLKASDKIDDLQQQFDDSPWHVFEDLKVRLKQKKDFLKQISTLRKKANYVIKNYKSELCSLSPFSICSLNFIDPLNRCGLLDKLIIWQELAKLDPDITNFYLWLENEPPLQIKKQLFPIDEAKVEFNNAIAYNDFWGKNTNNILDGAYLYVLAPDSSLYIAPNYINYKHSDISKEPFAIGAGQIIFKNGKITYINRQSGHYLPEEKHLNYVINSLEKKYTKNIFSVLVVDNSLETSLEYDKQNLIIKRSIDKVRNAILSDNEKLQKKELTLFDLGFND